MRISRSVHARRKVGVLFMLVGLLTGTFSVFGPQALADPITPGSTIGGFEIDGTSTPNPAYDPTDPNEKDPEFLVTNSANFAFDGTGTIDWATVPNLASRLHFDDEYQPGDDGNDQGFSGGDKEFEPAGWSCAPDSGDDPQKDDIHWVLSYPSLSLSNSIVAFAFYRDKPEGNTNVVLELNRNSMDSCNGAEGRTIGDLILHFDFPGGDDAADLEAYVWNGTTMVPFDVPSGVAKASTNSATLAVPASLQASLTAKSLPTNLPARTFGEAAIDLVALQAALAADPDIGDEIDPDILECPGVGFANIRTRSSGEANTSQLHDLVPEIPIDLSDCASLKIKKVDDLGQPMEGIQFGLFATEAHAIAGTPLAQLPTTPPQDLVCTTDAAGICSFPKVPDGDYYLNELNLPAGYTPDPDLPAAVHLDPFQDLDWSDSESEWFVNTLQTGSVVVTKVVVDGEGDPLTLTDITYLNGITFELQDDQGNTIQKRSGGDATCTLVLDDPADDPSCQIDDVPFGTYDVVEDASTLPAGLSAGPAVPVTVDEESPAVAEVDYENPADPLNISIDKAGPNTANVGDTITYEFNVGLGDLPFDTTDDVDLQPLTSVQVTELVNASDPGQLFADRCDTALSITDKDDVGPLGDDWLEDGEVWTYECDHDVTMAEATDSDGTELWNRAQVEGTDRYDRTDTDTDDHLVTILLPDVVVEKTPDDGVILPGDDAEFSITVSNDGPGRANDVVLTDTLPAGIAWEVVDDDGATCGIALGVLTCDIGDLAAGAEVTITLSGPTDSADCGEIPNTASASASNELEEDEANNSDDGLITVSCADVTVEKTAADDSINAGDEASFTIVVTNLSDTAAATDVELSDPLPDGVDWTLSGEDAADCDITGTGDDQVLSCDFGTVEASGTRTVTVSGATDPADCGTLPNTATVSSSNEAEGADDNNESSDTITVECPNVWVEKTGPASVNATDTITWTITFGNDGDGDAYDVVLTDELPSGLTGYVLGGDDAGLCELAAGTVTCSFDVLESGAEHSITVTGTTDVGDCPEVTNPVSIEASNEDEADDGDNTDSATTDVLCPDLGITKVADDDVVDAGDQIGFEIVVTNDGPGVAYGVTLDDPLPTGDGISWSIESQSGGAGCEIDAGTLTCGPIDLADNASFTVHVVSDTDPTTDECVSDVLTNLATADADNDAPEQASDDVTILCPGVNLTKAADDLIVDAGDQIGFTITVSNIDDGVDPAEGTAQDVVVTDELPGDLAWEIADDSDLPEGATCDIDEGVLTCELGDLPAVDAEDAPQVTIHVVADTTEADCAVYDNTASATVDNGADPDDADATSRVRCPISIDLDKTGDTIAHVGDVVDYEFTVTNTGGEDLLDVVLTDVECDAGTITLVDDGDGDAVLAAGTWDDEAEEFTGGEVWAYTCTRTLTAADVVVIDGADFALNTGAVRGEDEDGREATDTDPHVVEIITPVIQVVKTVDDDTPAVGQTVTYTYVVTNTGDTTLFDVAVVDDILGAIGTIDELAVGASATLTKTMVVAANSPTRNVATATGEDVLGKTVTDDDDATITVVLGAVIVPPAPPAPVVQPQALPRTGADSQRLLILSGVLLLLGGVLLASGQGVAPRHVGRRRQG